MKSVVILTWLYSKPLYPKEVHLAHQFLCDLWMTGQHRSIEYSNNAGIPVWLCMLACFWRLDHNIRVCLWIYSVPITSDIIGGIVDMDCFTTIYLFACNVDSVSLLICELAVCVTVVVSVKQVTKQMVFQLWNEPVECRVMLVFTDVSVYVDRVLLGI